jgi:shikimate kinase
MTQRAAPDKNVAPSPSPPISPFPSSFDGNLYLIGYRGSGKSTVAAVLAGRLGWQWVDLDERLEARSGISIRALFAREGEEEFRRREATLLEEVSRLRRCVVATGGGAVLAPGNRVLLHATGKSVWLTADPATLWRRLQTDPITADRRPPLTHGGLAEIEELLSVREPFYRECADCTVDTVNRTPQEAAALILAHFKLG